jgi:hypothetical protein
MVSWHSGIRNALACAGLAAACAVHAAPVTFSFTGSVTDDPYGLGFVSFVGSYTFESAALDAAPAASTGSYDSSGAGFGIAVDFDGGAATASVLGTLNIGIANDFAGPVDQYTVTGLSGTVELGLFFEDLTATALGSDALPQLTPALADYAFRQFRWFDTDTNDPREILGTVDSLVCTAGCNAVAVPEPGSLLLLVVAVLAGSAVRLRHAGAA